jgi:hypothetical protein
VAKAPVIRLGVYQDFVVYPTMFNMEGE